MVVNILYFLNVISYLIIDITIKTSLETSSSCVPQYFVSLTKLLDYLTQRHPNIDGNIVLDNYRLYNLDEVYNLQKPEHELGQPLLGVPERLLLFLQEPDMKS